MKTIRKIMPLALSVCATSIAFAGSSEMKDVRTKTANGNYGALTASSSPKVEEGFGITFGPIFRQALVDGTEFTVINANQAAEGAKYPTSCKGYEVKFDWDWGVKAGLSYQLGHDNWDAAIDYHWLKSKGSRALKAPGKEFLIPLKGYPGIISKDPSDDKKLRSCAASKAKLEMDTNVLDLSMGRGYFVSENLSFRPAAGVKLAWISLEQDTNYSLGADLGDKDSVTIQDESHYFGVGPNAEIGSKWHIGKGFNIQGSFGAALLYGHFKVDHKEKFNKEQKLAVNGNINRLTPALNGAIGVGYDTYLDQDKHHLSIGLSYEIEHWARQNQMLRVEDVTFHRGSRIQGDAASHGVSLDIKWAF